MNNPKSEVPPSKATKDSPDGGVDQMDLVNMLEGQQKTIGQLQVRLNNMEEKAVKLDNTVFEMRSLLQSGKGFSEILSLSTLLEAFMAVCRERYASINSVVLLLDDFEPTEVFYRVRGYFGLPNSFVGHDGLEEELYLFKMPHDQGLLWQLIQQGDVFAVRDMRKLTRFETAFKRWNLNVLESDVWVPLMRGSNVLGVLTLGECEDGSQIPESDYTFLQEIAAVAATNIDSTLKYEKNERILNNLRTLYDVNQQLANVNDFKELTEETLSSAVSALNAQKANLMLFNPETNRLEIKVVSGHIPLETRNAINDGSLKTRSFEIGEGVAGMAAKTRKPIRINDRSKIEHVGRNPVYCIISAPILHGDEVKGVMTLTNKVTTDAAGSSEIDTLSRFGEEDEQLLVSLADQAAQNLNKARLYSASITDRLTGLFNARHFESRFHKAVHEANRNGESLCLAIVDADHFKQFNDTHGHAAGDLVLQALGKALRGTLREGSDDQCFRYGGEEFCMLLKQTALDKALALLEGFRKTVESTVLDWEGNQLKVTVSIGISTNADGTHPLDIFEAADKALYASKSNGRNRVSYSKDDTFLQLDTK
jgi:diguanylate cyclase (GGDEF)-like protein